jgi:hypothetical protein
MKIIGLRIEKYIGTEVTGQNCDFDYHDAEFERHILLGVLSDNRKVKITLWEEQGECGSGWCCASWGHMQVDEVTNFGGYTYISKKELIIDDIKPNASIEDIDSDDSEDWNINNKVFNVSYCGGDCYYPGGSYNVDINLFTETSRHKDKRPVWIFKGESNSGKSFIASHLNKLSVYETDSSNILPDIIKEDVIVLGNKYKFAINDIKERIFGDCEICIVNFEI